MKKTLFILSILLFIMIVSAYLFVQNTVKAKELVLKENLEYEEYCNETIQGVTLVTLINKAIDNNEKNNIEKNEKNYYIENNENSIRIEVKMLSTEKTYAMEEIYMNNITEFVKYFNLADFKCINKEYHTKTGKIKKIVFEEVN